MSTDRFHALFNPRSIAIIGASSNPNKTAGRPLHNLLAAKFEGEMFPINPTVDEVEGVKCYPSVTDLPKIPDLALSMVEASLVPKVIDECGQKGIKVVIVGSGGFNEAGKEGEERQAALTTISKKYNIRICGPNCNGVYNVLKGIPIGYNFVHALRMIPGSVAIASQSGALLGSIAHRALRMGLGLSYFVSTGNEMDWDLCDYVDFFISDEKTKIIALLIEGIQDGQRLLDLVRKAHLQKKIVVALKVGKTERGAVTAAAHTARMAGSGAVYEAAFHQFGVISADTIEAFLGVAQMAATQPPPNGGKLMVLSSTGGGASLIADKAEQYGIELAEVNEKVKKLIPARNSAIVTNPFDIAGSAQRPGFLQKVCEVFASDSANDCLLLFLHELIVRDVFAANFCDSARKAGKTALAFVNLPGEETEQIFRQSQVPLFDGATDACLSALRSFIRYGRFRVSHDGEARERNISAVARPIVKELLDRVVGPSMLSEEMTRKVLGEYGFQTPEYHIVFNSNDAVKGADAIGYPLILKGAVPGIAHKSAIGLVSPKILNKSELIKEYDGVRERVCCSAHEPDSVGIVVEKYIPHDYEIILGVKYDATFGPVVLFGLGGIFAEILKDCSIRLAPVVLTDVFQMLTELKAFPIFREAFSAGSLSYDGVAASVLRLSDLALELNGRIAALDINPLALVRGKPEGVVLDAKVHLCDGDGID